MRHGLTELRQQFSFVDVNNLNMHLAWLILISQVNKLGESLGTPGLKSAQLQNNIISFYSTVEQKRQYHKPVLRIRMMFRTDPDPVLFSLGFLLKIWTPK
jgi:hypothetical protein